MNGHPFRSFAVVPAAGASRRMGVDKLLLPIGGVPLIQRVLSEWARSRVDQTIVVVDHQNKPLLEACRGCRAHRVVAKPTPREMKHSVQRALREIQDRFAPHAGDAWLLAPADLPGLSHRLIDPLIDLHDPDHPTIIALRCQGHIGHPTLFPWPLAGDVFSLADDQGVNVLLERYPVQYAETDDPSALQDIDTPADYR